MYFEVTPTMVGQIFPQFVDDWELCETIAYVASAPSEIQFAFGCRALVVAHYPQHKRYFPEYLQEAGRYAFSRRGDLRLWTALVRWIDDLEQGGTVQRWGDGDLYALLDEQDTEAASNTNRDDGGATEAAW